MKRIAIVGLGQIGGSIVLTLRKNHKQYFITGIDTSSKRLHLLKTSLHRASKKWNDAADADIVIVCLHYKKTVEFLQQFNPDRLLMDACSGKAKLVRLANRRNLRYVGGHPMAGNEFAGEKGWRDNLFEGASFFLCTSKKSSQRDLTTVRTFVKDLGAHPVVVDANQHDRFVSITSHFPAILAELLNKMGKPVPAHFRGPGFRSMTRLANTPPDLLHTFLESNGENMIRTAKQMRKFLDGWIKKVEIQRKGARAQSN